MEDSSLKLYLEINNLSFIFLVGESDEYDNFKIVYNLELPLQGIENNRIINLEQVLDVIKKNVYIVEQKLNHTFKEIFLILENFELTFINFSGFKKLNGSQISRENITYILNNLKSCVDKSEPKKNILHIFNSKFNLDNKKIDNLPIGLFGDSYSHELSFILINKNEYRNLKTTFDKCNLKIKKIFIKSFFEGVHISKNNKNCDTFFKLKIFKNNSKIFYFENNSLKFEQIFQFGSDIIIKDISKIISLKKEIVEIILSQNKLTSDISEDELIEKDFFNNDSFRKIKKKLIYEIALARIKEIFDLILFKNINLKFYHKCSKNIFLEFSEKSHSKTFREISQIIFYRNNYSNLNFTDNLSNEGILSSVNKLVHFGWDKEAIPISHSKKSLIARLFDTLFG